MELRKVPFLKLTLAFTLGVLVAYHFKLSSDAGMYLVYIAAPFLILSFLVPSIFKLEKHTQQALKSLFIYLTFFTIGLCRTIFHSEINSPQHFSKHPFKLAIARVISEPEKDDRTIRFVAEIQSQYSEKWVETLGKVRFTVLIDSITQKFNYGDVFITTSNIKAVSGPLNPGEFDAEAWLRSKNIYHTTFANSSNIFLSPINQGNSLIKYSYDLRKKQVEKYKQLIKDTTAYSIASTLILGYRSDLSQDVLQSFSNTGTIHALSVSGAHVAILFLFVHNLFYFLRNGRLLVIIKLLLILFILWSYALITGFSPSVLRSVIMISLYIVATYLNLKHSSLNIMAFSAIALIFYHPPYIADIGFQLSYFAVAGLILLQPILQELIEPRNSWIEKMWSYCAMSLAAQIATLPLSIYYFHQFPVYFLIGNLFILLPLNLIMALGALVLFPYLEILALPLEICIQYTYRGLYWISQFPFSLIANIHFSQVHVLLLSAVIISPFVGFKLKRKFPIYLSIIITIFLQIDLLLNKINSKNKLTIYSLKNEFGLSFETGSTLQIFSSLHENSPNYKYSIVPSTKYPSIREVNFKHLIVHSNESNHKFIVLHLNDFKIFLADSCIKNKVAPKNFDLILFTGYSNISFEELSVLRNSNKAVIFTHQLPQNLRKTLSNSGLKTPYILMNQKHIEISL